MIFINKCPFCGSNDSTIIESILEETYYVYCRECSSQGPAEKEKEEAVKKWNKATEDKIREGMAFCMLSENYFQLE